jgi:flagellin
VYYDETQLKYGLKLSAMWGSSENDISIGYSGTETFFDTMVTSAGAGTRIHIQDSVSARGALNTVWEAIKNKDEYRAKMGYLMNRLESAISVVDIEAENLLAAESRIGDVDVATEMAAMTRYQVLAQAGISMLSQANTMPQMALQLLQG